MMTTSANRAPHRGAFSFSIFVLAGIAFSFALAPANAQSSVPSGVASLLSNSTFAVRVNFPASTSWNVSAVQADSAYSSGTIDGGYLIITGREFSEYQDPMDAPNDTQVIPAGIPLQYVIGSNNDIYVMTSAPLPGGYMALFGFQNQAGPLALHPPRSLNLTTSDFVTMWDQGIRYLSDYEDKFLSLTGIALTLYKDLATKGLVTAPLSDLDVLLRTNVEVLNNTGRRVVIVVARNGTDCLGAGPLYREVADRWWPKGAADRCGTASWEFTLTYKNLGSSWFVWSGAYGDNGTVQTVLFDDVVRAQHTNYGADIVYTTNPVPLPAKISMAHSNVWSGNRDDVVLVFQADDVVFSNTTETPAVGGTPTPIKAFIDPGWTRSGLPDHLEISPISSPQVVGAAIKNVVITARSNREAPVLTNGSVSLGSSQGRVTPTNVSLVGGTATVDVTLSNPGNDVQLTATGLGVQGESNTFNVTGGINLGSLEGLVYHYVNGTVSRVDGATVELQDRRGINRQIAVTANGWYRFSRIPCGVYSKATASDGSFSSTSWAIDVPCNYQTATQDFFVVPASCGTGGPTPVLLVPGAMGSTTNGLVWDYPSLPRGPLKWDDKRWPSLSNRLNPGGIQDVGGFRKQFGWEDLIRAFESVGYQRGCTVFAVPYDWRELPTTIATKVLKKRIDDAKSRTGAAIVDIVAHSMGGLVSRTYIQSEGYQDDVRKLAMVGTPNEGSPKGYFVASGGDPVLADKFGSDDLYQRVSEAQWRLFFGHTVRHSKSFVNYDTDSDRYRSKMREFYRSHIPSVAVLLPHAQTFLKDPKDVARALVYDKNPLTDLLDGPNSNRNRLGTVSGSGSVSVKLFPGTGQNTIQRVLVSGQSSQSTEVYPDGWPRWPYWEPTEDGDGTVEVSSVAPLDWKDRVAIVDPLQQGEHSKLMGVYKADLVQFISGVRPAATAPHINATPPPTLSVSILGSAQPYMTDAQGLGAGINPATESAEDAIAGSAVSAGIDEAAINIDNPSDGSFNLALSAPSPQDYHLEIQYADSSGNQSLNEWLFNHGGTSHVTLTLNAASAGKIALSGLPAPPSGLVADAEGSGPRTTKLMWQPSPDSGVTYNVYSRKIDEPFLQSAGTTAATTLSLADPWAVDASVPTRIYTVAAVRHDGTESFLSNYDFNNDRDHDGATDAEETARSTDPDNPDMDSDGFQDGDEAIRGTDPRSADTDLDGFLDGYEVKTGSDPLDANSTPKPNGDATGDGYVTVADLFHLINYVFSPGAAPVNGADVNGDGKVDAADIFCLISYLFSGGPAPV